MTEKTNAPEFEDAYKGHCPVMAYPFFMRLEHPDYGMVDTYGGPFDSYTLPYVTDDGSVLRERYDHDEGGWVEDIERICCSDCLDLIRAQTRAIVDLREKIKALAIVDEMPPGAKMIADERRRQIEAEGWDEDHDEQHVHGELLRAAACYMEILPPTQWPWLQHWFKPKNKISDLKRAGALIAAEIDRLGRLSSAAEKARQE